MCVCVCIYVFGSYKCHSKRCKTCSEVIEADNFLRSLKQYLHRHLSSDRHYDFLSDMLITFLDKAHPRGTKNTSIT